MTKATPAELAKFRRRRQRAKADQGVALVLHNPAMRKHLRKLDLLPVADEYTNDQVAAALARLPELACRLLGK